MRVERIFTGGRIFTADGSDGFAEAFAVSDGVVVAVGDASQLAGLVGEHTETIELGGAFVMPGFVDAHNHYHLQGQTDLFEVPLPSDLTLDEILDVVAEKARELPTGEWLVLSPYGPSLVESLSRADALARLDGASAGHPVMVREYSRHNRWVNSDAMRLAGITRDSPDPAHGALVRDPSSGAPTGVLVESAGIPVEHAFLAARGFTAEENEAKVRRGVEVLHGFGVTAFQDGAASAQSMEGAAALDRAGRLNAWVVSSMPVNEQIFGFDPRGDALLDIGAALATEHHRPEFIKVFMDGVPPAHTAAFLDPYLPTDKIGEDYRAPTLLSEDALVAVLERAASRGLSAKIHCTGDASVRTALDAIARVRAAGHAGQRYQIAHAQFISEPDVARFAELDVTVEISPYFWTPGPVPDAIRAVMGEHLIDRMHPNRDLIDAGALVVVGSDWPCSDTPNPWFAVHGLVDRSDPLGIAPGRLVPPQAVTLAEALRMVTIDGARSLGLHGRTGSIEPGKSADFIVTDRDPFMTAVDRLSTVSVAQTWFAGKRVR